MILAKLTKDEYVNKKYASDGKLALFHITYDGHIFLKSGGYSEVIKSQKREKRRQIILDCALIMGGFSAVIVAIPYHVKLFTYFFCCLCFN